MVNRTLRDTIIRSTTALIVAAVLTLAASTLKADGYFSFDDAPPAARAVDHEAEGPLLASEPFLPEAEEAYFPPVTARLGALLLQRSRPASNVLISEIGTGRTLLNTDQLDYPFQGGVDATLVWHGRVADLEFRYFGIEQWEAARGPVFSSAGVQLHFPDSDPEPGPINVMLSGSSSLQSFELNLRRNVAPRWSLLAGLRYVLFRDGMNLGASDPISGSRNHILFGTMNYLYGLQCGADGILWNYGRRFRIESALKAGIYVNGAGVTLRGGDSASGEQFRYHAGSDQTAFIGDMNFVGVYQLGEHWAIRGGYQLLWLTGVALATEQINGFTASGFRMQTTDTVFFHGALLGLECGW